MTKNNLKLLDQDEHLREEFENRHKFILTFCRAYDLTLDCATSDVCMYLDDEHGGSICLG